MRSRLNLILPVLVMVAIGLALAFIAHRVDDLGEQLEQSQADRVDLHAKAEALEKQVRSLGGKPVTEVPPGPAGAAGATGPMGPAGLDGKDGSDGKDGKAGATGRTGAAGADGDDGATGATGAQGQPGPTGPPGPAGADGKDGANGTNGTDGADGKDGRGVESVTCEGGSGRFTFAFTDGTTATVECSQTGPLE